METCHGHTVYTQRLPVGLVKTSGGEAHFVIVLQVLYLMRKIKSGTAFVDVGKVIFNRKLSSKCLHPTGNVINHLLFIFILLATRPIIFYLSLVHR